MNQQTTRQETRIPLLHGWLSSIAIHGLILLSVFLPFRQSLTTVHTEPFHWDVALVQTIPTAHKSIQPADVSQPAIPKPDHTSASHANHRIRHTVLSTERMTALAPKTGAPVTPKSRPDSPSPFTSPKEAATTSTPNELSPTLAQSTEPLSQQTETPIGSTTPASPRPETAAPAATLEESTPSTDSTQPPAPPTESDIADVSAIRPDYGWLQQAISRRLEEIKRSLRPSLDESRPLKVTVKAVVSREGILLDSAVVKSSGLDRIDQEAIALVQRAFPMQFDRTLDRQHIVMRIPITYSRE